MWPASLLLRLGKKESFTNVAKAQCHAVGTACMNVAESSLHENVQGYDSQMLDKSCDHSISMALSPDLWYLIIFMMMMSVILKHIDTNPLLQTPTYKLPGKHPRLHPQLFGYPTGRPRQYRNTWDPKAMNWFNDSWGDWWNRIHRLNFAMINAFLDSVIVENVES